MDSLLNTRIKLSREAGHPSCAYRKDGTMIKEEGQEFGRNFDVGKDMLRMEKAWEAIRISNDFLFGKIMRRYPGLCRKLLQRILPELPIGCIEILETQKSIREDADGRYKRASQEKPVLFCDD